MLTHIMTLGLALRFAWLTVSISEVIQIKVEYVLVLYCCCVLKLSHEKELILAVTCSYSEVPGKTYEDQTFMSFP